jgi:twitching motility protein PilJ
MGAGTEYAQEYGQAEKAYLQGNYEHAASIIDQVVEQFPDEASALLLRGHIYCYGLQQYEEARKQYERVLAMTDEPDFVTYANNGLDHANQLENQVEASFDDSLEADEPLLDESSSDSLGQTYELLDSEVDETQWVSSDLEDTEELDLGRLELEGEENSDSTFEQELGEDNPFMTLDEDVALEDDFDTSEDNPFALSDSGAELDWSEENDKDSLFADFGERDFSEEAEEAEETQFLTEDSFESDAELPWQEENEAVGLDAEYPDFDETEFLEEDDTPDLNAGLATFMTTPDSGVEAENFEVTEEEEYFETLGSDSDGVNLSLDEEDTDIPSLSLEDEQDWLDEEDIDIPSLNLEDEQDWLDEEDEDTSFQEETLLMASDNLALESAEDKDTEQSYEDETEIAGDFFSDQLYVEEEFEDNAQNGTSSMQDFDFEELEQDYGVPAFEEETTPQTETEEVSEGFLEEFDVFSEDIDEIDNLNIEDMSGELPDSGFGLDSNLEEQAFADSEAEGLIAEEEEAFSIGNTTAESLPTSFAPPTEQGVETQVEVDQGPLAAYLNAPLQKKNWLTAASAGVVSAIAVAVVSFGASTTIEENKAEVVGYLRGAGALMALAGGAASFGTTLFLGRTTRKQIERSTTDLQTQFESVSQGDFNAKATVYSEDEFGQLASGFNQMARVILTTTSEAQRKAEEQEQAKEDLQRQVIRLLDDVEGAARGDLTVQAEVTADVLGAVADAFNLTIQNLREIVMQVKRAARQVSRGSTENESFARGLSSDALRQAEELAVTLNSVQMMTDSIQRVAENAREAEEVARSASATALKGGEAVEHTVAGILQIRETVAETARKVKRLAESSQEISKIVAVVSSIASRTNLLALNASIEAARAGEAGRGFAIVADEVRQLADRSAKALKEIEQIVLQIQSETNLVMTAMEEGTQQVIDGTKRAEQAKGSLEDIIQVSNRIDALVRSITADTVEQTETSRAVAQVMQSVELTAQETSQEAQRVSGSLQSLVTIARDLLTSVERFRVESTEEETH